MLIEVHYYITIMEQSISLTNQQKDTVEAEIIKHVRALRKRGWVHIDQYPDNIAVVNGYLKFIDLESLARLNKTEYVDKARTSHIVHILRTMFMEKRQ